MLESITAPCSVTGTASGIVFRSDLMHCTGLHLAVWMAIMVLLLVSEDEPPRCKGLTPVHVICMKLPDNGGGREHTERILNTDARGVYRLDVEHLADHPRLLEVIPDDQLIVLNDVVCISAPAGYLLG